MGCYLPFPRTNYDTKKSLVWDLTDKHRYLSLRLEVICRHPSSKEASLPTFLKPNVVNIYLGLILLIYLLTAIGLSPGGRNTVHIYTQTIHRTIQNKQYIEQHNNWKSAGRAQSWHVLPWHLPYNRGKSTEKPQSG